MSCRLYEIHRKGDMQIVTGLYIHTWSLNNALVLPEKCSHSCACHCANTALHLSTDPLPPSYGNQLSEITCFSRNIVGVLYSNHYKDH